MKALFFVLNQTEKLDELLDELLEKGITGATILESKGMVRVMGEKNDENEFDFLNSVRHYLKKMRENSHVIFIVLEDEQVEAVVKIIERIVGDLELPDTGLVFTVPIDFVRGLRKDGK